MSQENLEHLQNTTAKRSLHLERALAKEIKSSLGRETYYKSVEVSPSHVNVMGQSLQNIAKDYKKKKDNNDLGLTILKGNHLLIKGSIASGLLLTPATGGISLIVAVGLGYVTTKGLDKAEETFKESMRQELRRNLKTQLEKYRVARGQQEYDNLLANPNATSFRQELENRVGSAFGTALDEIPPEEQDIVNAFRTKELAAMMKDGFSFLAGTLELQSNQIEQNNRNIIGLARSFTRFAENNQKQLDSIVKTQNEIKDGITSLSHKVDQTQQGVEFIQEFMFGKMTPAEQENALRRGMFPGMPEKERKELEEKVALAQKREEFNQTVTSYLNGAAELVNIARNFGVDPEIIKTVETAVNVGNQAFAAFTAFSSGNFLAGASAISNIFGIGGGRDIAGERHQQVMDKLDTIYERIDVIDRKIDILIEGQDRIMRAQQETFNAIVTLSEQVQNNQRELIEKLQEIQGDVLYNRRLIAETVLEEYALCDVMVNHAITGKQIIDTSTNNYPTYDEFVDLYRAFKRSYEGCVTRQQKTRGIRLEFHTIFMLETYKKLDNSVSDYISKVYEPAWNLLATSKLSQKSLNERASSLFSPMSDVMSLETKTKEVTDAYQPRFRRSFETLMADPLAPPAVKMHTDYILNYHFYYQLVNPDTNNPYKLEDLIGLDEINEPFALYENLSLVDIAIAQQCLVAGDFLLPIMFETFRLQIGSPSDSDKELLKQVKQLLENNSLLTHNFVLYTIRKEVLSKSNILNYSIALGRTNNDSFLLKQVTEFPWDFQWSKENVLNGNVIQQREGWSIKLDDTFIPLPTAEELSDGKLMYPPDLYMLMSLRSRILDELNSYNIFDGMSKVSRLRFNEVLLNTV